MCIRDSLFTLLDEGPGFPFFLPNGMVLKNTLLEYWREIHHRHGYVEISTPIILNQQLWHRSGHWDHYKDCLLYTSTRGGQIPLFFQIPFSHPDS